MKGGEVGVKKTKNNEKHETDSFQSTSAKCSAEAEVEAEDSRSISSDDMQVIQEAIKLLEARKKNQKIIKKAFESLRKAGHGIAGATVSNLSVLVLDKLLHQQGRATTTGIFARQASDCGNEGDSISSSGLFLKARPLKRTKTNIGHPSIVVAASQSTRTTTNHNASWAFSLPFSIGSNNDLKPYSSKEIPMDLLKRKRSALEEW